MRILSRIFCWQIAPKRLEGQMKVRGLKRLAAGMYLLVSSSVAWAQKITATMRGDVTDASGAAVAGAKVVVRNEATNAERDAITNDCGAYVIDLLPAGLY